MHLAAQIADRVLQLLGHVADGASGAEDDGGRIGSSVHCRQGDRVSSRLASSLRSYDPTIACDEKNVFVLGSTLVNVSAYRDLQHCDGRMARNTCCTAAHHVL